LKTVVNPDYSSGKIAACRKLPSTVLETVFLQVFFSGMFFIKFPEVDLLFAGVWQTANPPMKSFEKILKENFFKSFP